MRPIFKLNDDQINKLSDIFSDIGLVALASVALPAVFDKVDLNRVISGLIPALTCWLISLYLRR